MNLIFSQSTSPTFNLAAEEYLFYTRQDDLLFLFVNEPSVIIGSNQAIQNEVNKEFCASNNIEIVRRLSGGGAVYHDLGNLNFSFISNKTAQNLVFNANFLKPIIDVLRSLNIDVEKGKRNDLWMNGASKISGTASHIKRTRQIQHGTLLYDANLDFLRESLSSQNVNLQIKAIPSVPSRVINIKDVLENQHQQVYTSEIFYEIFKTRMMAYFNLASTSVLTISDINLIENLAETKYRSLEWTYKK